MAKKEIKMNGFDPEDFAIAPALITPASPFCPPPAYNPNMTQPSETRGDITVAHQTGEQAVLIKHSMISYGSEFMAMTCPWCKTYMTTRIDNKPTTNTYIYSILLAPLCLCFIPFLLSSCQAQEHYCSKCNRYLGTCDR